MFTNFRPAMTWLHTWMGLTLGFVLMVCFFFGSLAVFDREIDRRAIPETHFEPQPMPSFDRMLPPILQRQKLLNNSHFRHEDSVGVLRLHR